MEASLVNPIHIEYELHRRLRTITLSADDMMGARFPPIPLHDNSASENDSIATEQVLVPSMNAM